MGTGTATAMENCMISCFIEEKAPVLAFPKGNKIEQALDRLKK
jgi:hypothetical protein